MRWRQEADVIGERAPRPPGAAAMEGIFEPDAQAMDDGYGLAALIVIDRVAPVSC